MIVANELRSALSSWSDRLVALAVLMIALIAVRSALSPHPFVIAATAVAALAAAFGAGTARLIERRLDFHAQDGVLAADALTDEGRRYYILSVHALVGAIATVGAVVGRPTAVVFAPIGYLVGAAMSHVAIRALFADRSLRRLLSLRAFGEQLRRPISGAIAAIPVILLLLVKSIDPGPLAVFVGLFGIMAALILTMLDYDVVRFMTTSGYSAGRIVGIHARSIVIFVALTAFASLILADRLVAAVAVVVGLAALTLMTARILAYRTHSKRTADIIVSIYTGIACLAGVAMPMFLPVVVIVLLWHLYRRAASATWLLS